MSNTLNDAISRARNVSNEAKKARQEKRKQTPLTLNNFIHYFYDLHEHYDYGTPLPQKKEVRNKLNGTLKLLKNNGMEDNDIREFIKNVVEQWPRLKKKDALTNNRKRYILADKPNLLDIVNCRDWLMTELEVQPEETEGKSLLDMWREG